MTTASSPAKIKFGTDGWRAVMDREYTTANVERLAQAFADYLKDQPKPLNKPAHILIGYDFRRNSENFADTFARVLTGNGIRVTLSDRATPTPALSLAVVRARADNGIMITASHNPAQYNGVKVKSSIGSTADVSVTNDIEARIDRHPIQRSSSNVNIPKQDLMTAYQAHIRSYVNMAEFQKRRCRVLVDAMHGVGATLMADLLKGTAVEVTTIRGDRDVEFGGVAPEPIPQNLKLTQEMMKTGQFDLAIVTDGDADRVGVIRPGGDFVTPGTVLSLLMLHLVEDRGRKGSVVTTLSNTSLIRRVARHLGLKVHETPVGFKYICEILKNDHSLIGGEESGGLAFQDYMFERDGTMSGLLLIQMMCQRNQSFEHILSDVEKRFGKFFYARADLHYPEDKKTKLLSELKSLKLPDIAGVTVVDKQTYDGVKFVLKDDAWLLFRISGTEPLLRIYAESLSKETPEKLVGWGKAYSEKL